MRYLLLLNLTVILYSNEQFVLISNQNFPVSHLLKGQIKQIYLKRIRFIKNIPIIPINYTAQNPLRKDFEKSLLKLSSKKRKRYWMNEHYLGIRPPIIQSSVESAIAFVKKVDGAVAYIPDTKLPADIRVLYKPKKRP